MTLAANAIRAALEKGRQPQINKFLNRLSKKLEDTDRVLDNMKKCPDGRHVVELILEGELTPQEKEVVRATLLRNGWDKCMILNSSENDERAGLCQVTLYLDLA